MDTFMPVSWYCSTRAAQETPIRRSCCCSCCCALSGPRTFFQTPQRIAAVIPSGTRTLSTMISRVDVIPSAYQAGRREHQRIDAPRQCAAPRGAAVTRRRDEPQGPGQRRYVRPYSIWTWTSVVSFVNTPERAGARRLVTYRLVLMLSGRTV